MTDLLTAKEHEALELSGKLANLGFEIIKDGIRPGLTAAEHDVNEWVAKIHDIQHMIMAQAAARAYPDRYRLLGGRIGDE